MAAKIDFEALKREVSLAHVLAHYGLLNDMKPPSGMSEDLRGPCPFCDAKRSFYAYADNKFYCHGCKAGGSVLDFVMQREDVNVREAAVKLTVVKATAPARALAHALGSPGQGRQAPAAPPSESADDYPWKADLTLLWDHLDALDAEGKYYEALGRLEDIITTYGPWYDDTP